MEQSTAKPGDGGVLSPQYFIITSSEPQYDLIKEHLLASSPHSTRSSYYFIRAVKDDVCICRIKAGYVCVLFYEIINHLAEGITDEDLREAITRPQSASPLPDYYYLTPEIEKKIRAGTSEKNLWHAGNAGSIENPG